MSGNIKRAYGFAITGLLTAGLFSSAQATQMELHGYGYQDYIQTDNNTYLGADQKGTWDNNFLGLVSAITLNDKSKLWAQMQASSTDQVRFTWFFIDYQFNNNLRGHIGRVKLPMGLYNEVIDSKYLQVSQLEPSMYQGASDMFYDAYHGIGLDYDQAVGAGRLAWQVYGGNIYDYTYDPATSDAQDRRTFGGRVTYDTPVDGLKFMLTLNRVQMQVINNGVKDEALKNEDREILSASYVTDDYDLKAEYGNHKRLSITSRGGYLQGAYHLNDAWTPYVRYDYFTTDKSQDSDPSYYQKTAMVGVEYKISSNISARIEDHFNHGYALPVADGEVTAGAGKTNWNLFVAGINFVF
jgi:hypothetical protein